MSSTYVSLLIGGIIALGGGYFAYQQFIVGDKAELLTQESAEVESESNDTFASILASGQDLRCEVRYNDGANISDGVVYLADNGERIRADIDIRASAIGLMNVALVRKGGYNYLLSSLMSDGVKTKITEEQRHQLFPDNDISMNDDVVFDCVSWSVEEWRFDLPAGVDFVDVESETAASVNMNLPAGGQCGLCDQVPAGEARDQCYAAFSC